MSVQNLWVKEKLVNFLTSERKRQLKVFYWIPFEGKLQDGELIWKMCLKSEDFYFENQKKNQFDYFVNHSLQVNLIQFFLSFHPRDNHN